MLSSNQNYQSFVAVVETGSVTRAAQQLGLPRPTVSRHIARLETDLGVALLHRTTRRVTTTPTGQRLYDRVRPLLEQWTDLEVELRDASDRVEGAVRVSVLPVLMQPMVPVLAHLARAHPRLAVELVMNVRLVDLRTEGFDAAVWAGDPRDPELVSRKVATGNVGLVASPDYLDANGTPQSVDDLASHTLLRGHSGSVRPRVFWPLREGGRFRVGGTLVSNDAGLLRGLALEGVGITLLSDLAAGAALQDGRLVRVLPDVVGRTANVRVLVARRSLLPTRVRVFLDAVADQFPL